MAIEIPLSNRNTVNLSIPSFTLDVNQIPVKYAAYQSDDNEGLVNLEWNYFFPQSIELCVTPQTQLEITQGVPLAQLGSVAYSRLQKTEFYKNRPPGVVLELTTSDSDALWQDMRHRLFPTVSDDLLSLNQIADVNQIFFHTIASGSTAGNSVFLTRDNNFLEHSEDFNNAYGVTILEPNIAWVGFQSDYNLDIPTSEEVDVLWEQQVAFRARLEAESS